MTNTNLLINGISLFSFSSALTYICFGETLDGTAINVGDQFKDSLNTISEDAESNGETGSGRYETLLINRDDAGKGVTSDYFKNKIVLESDKTTLDKSRKSTNEERKDGIKKDQKNNSTIKTSVKRLIDECRWAYGRYINRGTDYERSGFHSLYKRMKSEESKQDAKNYEYGSDVYLACSKKGDKKLPMGGLSESYVHLYYLVYKSKTTTSTPAAATK